jgi:hypothetical protein
MFKKISMKIWKHQALKYNLTWEIHFTKLEEEGNMEIDHNVISLNFESIFIFLCYFHIA